MEEKTFGNPSERSMKALNPTKQTIARILEKNQKLEQLESDNVKMQKKLEETEKLVFQKKIAPIKKDLKELESVFMTFGMETQTLLHGGKWQFYYNIKQQEINSLSPYGTHIEEESSILQQDFVNNVVNKWDSIYEGILQEIEQKLDKRIPLSEKELDGYTKELKTLKEDNDLTEDEIKDDDIER